MRALTLDVAPIDPSCSPCCPSQLNLSCNQLGDAGAAEFAKVLTTNRALTNVCMVRHSVLHACGSSRCEARIDIGRDTHYAFHASLCLVQLYLNSNQIGDAGAAELAKALATNNTLTEVCIAWHTVCVTGRAEAHIGVMRRPLPHSVHAPLCSAQLGLDSNQLGDACAAELAKVLATNRTLTHVCCDDTLHA